MVRAANPPAHQTDIRSREVAPVRTNRVSRAWRRDKHLYALFTLPVIYFAVFQYAPMYGVLLAFKDYSVSRGILGSPWVGLDNFRDFFDDPYSWKLIRNTFVINIYQIAGAVGITPRLWLLDADWFRTIFVSAEIWQSAGWGAIIYLAAIAAIDTTLYEAAWVDGANRWQRIIDVTLPSIAPTITVLFLLRLGAMMTLDYQKILLLYTGATRETADVLGTYIYRRGLEGSDFSYATTVGLFQALVGLIFVVSSNAIARRLSDSSLW